MRLIPPGTMPGPILRRPLQVLDPPASGDWSANPVVELPPTYYPPIDGVFFDYVAFVNLPANGPANETTVITFLIPPGYNGVIRWLGNVFLGGGFTDGSGNVIWIIYRDDVPVQNYEKILASLGSLVMPSDTFIPLHEGTQVRMTVQTANVAPAGGTTTGCRLKGWWYPKARDVRHPVVQE